MILLSTILGLINGIKVVCFNTILAVSLCGKVIILAFEVLFDYCICIVYGFGVVFDEFRNFTIEQVFLLSSLKALVDNVFHGVMKGFCDLGLSIIDFLFHGKVQAKAIVSSLENGIIGLFSLLSKALIWIGETIVEVVLFFPQTAYRAVIKSGEIANYSSGKIKDFAVHVIKTVLRDIASYSLAMISIFLILKYRRQILRFGQQLLSKIIRMILRIPTYLRSFLPQRDRRRVAVAPIPQRSPIRLRPTIQRSPVKTALDVSPICVICQDQPKCVVLLPCKHLCLCKECNDHYFHGFCPLCRTNIQKKLIVFI
ncbi:RNF26 family protein [Megaselia abdita]